MREHGVLKRVLMVYGEAIRRIDGGEEVPVEVVLEGAKIIRGFIEDYHEKLEEDFVFPRFRKANRMGDLVGVLVQQHQGGRKLTELIQRYANVKSMREAGEKRALRDSMGQFVRMYGPHEAREDTVLFPAMREVVGGKEYEAMGEEFEKKETELFGEGGFEKVVERVAKIERAMGIYELSQFTPKV